MKKSEYKQEEEEEKKPTMKPRKQDAWKKRGSMKLPTVTVLYR